MKRSVAFFLRSFLSSLVLCKITAGCTERGRACHRRYPPATLAHCSRSGRVHSPSTPPLPSLSSGYIIGNLCFLIGLPFKSAILNPIFIYLFIYLFLNYYYYFFEIGFEVGDFSIRNFHIWCSDVSSLKIATKMMAEYDASQFHPCSLKCVLSLDRKQAQAVCTLYSL
jgi:hypothetical protein